VSNENIRIFREKLNPPVARNPAESYLEPMEIETAFVCVFCFQVNDTLVDASGGPEQEYSEDCQVCCRPNYLRVSVHPSLREAHIEASIP